MILIAKQWCANASSPPQESSSFLSCWGTRYSFPSCKNIHRMFLLRQSLIEKKRKNNGYEKVIANDNLTHSNNKTLKRVQGDNNDIILNFFVFYFEKNLAHIFTMTHFKNLARMGV